MLRWPINQMYEGEKPILTRAHERRGDKPIVQMFEFLTVDDSISPEFHPLFDYIVEGNNQVQGQ